MKAPTLGNRERLFLLKQMEPLRQELMLSAFGSSPERVAAVVSKVASGARLTHVEALWTLEKVKERFGSLSEDDRTAGITDELVTQATAALSDIDVALPTEARRVVELAIAHNSF
jgi:hypothetical protein